MASTSTPPTKTASSPIRLAAGVLVSALPMAAAAFMVASISYALRDDPQTGDYMALVRPPLTGYLLVTAVPFVAGVFLLMVGRTQLGFALTLSGAALSALALTWLSLAYWSSGIVLFLIPAIGGVALLALSWRQARSTTV